MILEAICRGNFSPTEDVNPQNPRYHQEWKQADRLLDILTEKLGKGDLDLVNQLLSHTGAAHCIECEEFFKLGFSAGLQLQKEAAEQLAYLDT